MAKGLLAFVLHAHLPFVRHPEYERFLEEDWLFEALSETYLPLLRAFERLKADSIPFKLTISLSPTLLSMLSDELLQNRYIAYLERTLELAEKELHRTKDNAEFHTLAKMYKKMYQQNLLDFTEKYKKNIVQGFVRLQKEGYLELITTAATHAYFPVYESLKSSVNAQVITAVENHRVFCGDMPKGFWLPELGYFPGVENILKRNGIQYFFSAAHSVLSTENDLKYGVFAPLQCENGLLAFSRDIPSSRAVWSESDGYPGDFSYRDFYRDIGHDLPLNYIRPYIHDNDIRVNTGFKYYAVTGSTDEKRVYVRSEADEKLHEHASNFLYNRRKQVKQLSGIIDRDPLIVAPFDAELFGHWWFEGPEWLEEVIRLSAAAPEDFALVTPSEYMQQYPENETGKLVFSSWGNNGYSEVWLDGSNDWIYRHVHKAVERMVELAQRFPDVDGLKERVLNQAAREVMLAQSSDWPFMIKMGTTVPYAVKRVKTHLYNFNKIYEDLCRNALSTEWVTSLEKKNNLLRGVDYRNFKSY